MVDKIKKSILRSLVKERRLTPLERLANRLGYMGTGFFITAPHLLPQDSGMVVYISCRFTIVASSICCKAMESCACKFKRNVCILNTIIKMNNIDKDKLLHFFWNTILLMPLVALFGNLWGCVLLAFIGAV